MGLVLSQYGPQPPQVHPSMALSTLPVHPSPPTHGLGPRRGSPPSSSSSSSSPAVLGACDGVRRHRDITDDITAGIVVGVTSRDITDEVTCACRIWRSICERCSIISVRS